MTSVENIDIKDPGVFHVHYNGNGTGTRKEVSGLSSLPASSSRKRKQQQSDLWAKVDSTFTPITVIDNSDLVDLGLDAVTTIASVASTASKCEVGVPTAREFCDACGFSVSITDEGFTACSNPSCSIIYKDVLDHSAEWRFYNADGGQTSDPTRCGMPINPLLAERITTVAHNNDIPKIIIDEALRHHKRVSEHKTFRGLNRDGVIAASVYVACRIHNCPRTAKEIASIFSLDITSATRGCKNALVIINEIESDMTNSDKTTFCKTTPNSFIERYCSKLSMNAELTQLCLFVASRIEKNQLIPENTPHSIAAGIVYFIAQTCSLNISKRDVNRVSEISEVTINKCFKKLDVVINTQVK